MTATNHGLAGSLLAVLLVKYPAVAICLAPFTHFLLDLTPHFGMKNFDSHSKRFYYILGTDMIVAVVTTLILAFVWSEIWRLIIVCAFLAASPDIMWFYYYYLKPSAQKDPVARFHSWIQWSQTPRGLITEAVWFLVLFPGLLIKGL
jgi:hypothetical protein